MPADKSDIVIALSPCFLPLWATVGVVVHALLGLAFELPPVSDKILFGRVGFFRAFHQRWTRWMIPTDQPDWQESGRFLPLVIIYLANQVVLAVLLCAVAKPLGFEEFGNQWVGNAAKSWDGFVRMAREVRF